jgi:hypothetical protein
VQPRSADYVVISRGQFPSRRDSTSHSRNRRTAAGPGHGRVSFPAAGRWWAAAAAAEQSIGVAVIKVPNESAQRHCVLDDALANDIQRASALGGRTGRAKATGRIENAKFGPPLVPSMPTCARPLGGMTVRSFEPRMRSTWATS